VSRNCFNPCVCRRRRPPLPVKHSQPCFWSGCLAFPCKAAASRGVLGPPECRQSVLRRAGTSPGSALPPALSSPCCVLGTTTPFSFSLHLDCPWSFGCGTKRHESGSLTCPCSAANLSGLEEHIRPGFPVSLYCIFRACAMRDEPHPGNARLPGYPTSQGTPSRAPRKPPLSWARESSTMASLWVIRGLCPARAVSSVNQSERREGWRSASRA